MPRILRLPALGFADLAHFGLELLVRCVELGLELGRVSVRIALEHLSVVCHDLVAVEGEEGVVGSSGGSSTGELAVALGIECSRRRTMPGVFALFA